MRNRNTSLGNISEEFIWHPIEEKVFIKKIYWTFLHIALVSISFSFLILLGTHPVRTTINIKNISFLSVLYNLN